jgi:ribulose-phosphate 3-epimerase
MKIELAPSILSSDFGAIRSQVQEMAAAGVDRIHFDVMDGQFVPPITFGAKMVADLADVGCFLEAHLMTLTPERHFEDFVKAGCKGIMFHVEASSHPFRHLQNLRQMGVQAGIAINPGTPWTMVQELLTVADLVLVMTVNPGWGGQAFISECLGKIRSIRHAAPEVDLEVDGGIDPTTLPLVVDAGANIAVTGSYLMGRPSIAQAVQELRASCG